MGSHWAEHKCAAGIADLLSCLEMCFISREFKEISVQRNRVYCGKGYWFSVFVQPRIYLIMWMNCKMLLSAVLCARLTKIKVKGFQDQHISRLLSMLGSTAMA